jgi:D-alanine-D-alanine ligase
MKKVCHFWGIKAPAYVVAVDQHGHRISRKNTAFSAHCESIRTSYSSIGLTKDSRVETPEALREQAEKMIATYGATLIEEFIDGREFSVLVVENADDAMQPFSYRPVEFVFPQGESFKHFDLKVERLRSDVVHPV